MSDGRARVNRVWGVIDRTTNNLLGEFPSREEADEFFNELLAADHRAGLHVEVVEAKGRATGSRAATWSWRFVAAAYVPILGFALIGVAILGHADDFWTRIMVCLGCAGLGSVYGVGIHDLWERLHRD